MSALTQAELTLSSESAGMLMTPEEFDAIKEYDENYRYELIHGVVVVNGIPSALETGPNELLGYYLLSYKEHHPKGSALSDTLPQQYVRVRNGRRLADRLIWTGLGRLADPRTDLPTGAVEFVSAGRRNRQRDYLEKRKEYGKAGLKEYWIIDRFRRIMTVIRYTADGPVERVVKETETYKTPLLPGFELPLAKILEAADRRGGKK